MSFNYKLQPVTILNTSDKPNTILTFFLCNSMHTKTITTTHPELEQSSKKAGRLMTQHYTTLPNVTQHYTTLHNITQHYTTLHKISQHYTALHNITQHYTTLHNTAQHDTTQHNIWLPGSENVGSGKRKYTMERLYFPERKYFLRKKSASSRAKMWTLEREWAFHGETVYRRRVCLLARGCVFQKDNVSSRVWMCFPEKKSAFPKDREQVVTRARSDRQHR